jgi:hypothetical protein
LRKQCRAPKGLIWQDIGVDQSVIDKIELLRPAIKRDWGVLLRAEPTLSPLGHPDTLAYLMDETISQVSKSVHSHSLKSLTHRAPVLLAPLQRHCHCGLNPLLNYYATGELALRTALRQQFDPATCEALLTVFHVRAQQEIETICAVCQVHDERNGRTRRSPASNHHH